MHLLTYKQYCLIYVVVKFVELSKNKHKLVFTFFMTFGNTVLMKYANLAMCFSCNMYQNVFQQLTKIFFWFLRP